MPIRQYFLRVGSILLVAMFAADWWLPAPVARPHSDIPPNERVNLRIRSDHKWPERVVFDTAHSGLSLAAGLVPRLVTYQPKSSPDRSSADRSMRSQRWNLRTRLRQQQMTKLRQPMQSLGPRGFV
jgi:hypothetical protein